MLTHAKTLIAESLGEKHSKWRPHGKLMTFCQSSLRLKVDGASPLYWLLYDGCECWRTESMMESITEPGSQGPCHLSF